MGMGYGANYADVIEQEDVRVICPVEFSRFHAALKTADMDVEEYATAIYFGDDVNGGDKDYNNVNETYKLLVKAFKDATRLDLYLAFHNSDDNGDRYDDVNGAYWAVDGMYQLSEAGRQMQERVHRKFFVTFG